jgi:hypothetical protein
MTMAHASSEFTPAETATLREHGIVIFADRVIYEAQPPMGPDEIATVQAQCAGPIPTALQALWSQTAGGRLDYDLCLSMNGHEEAISWAELFFNGSDAYRDLQGWIDHEQELAEEHDASWNGKLRCLPFGGFEYCDRIYAVVEPGPEHGQVLAWKQGLPPAWTHAMHDDGIATVAADVASAFKALNLHQDPLAPTEDFHAGQSLLEYLDGRVNENGLSPDLADKLIAFYRKAIVDWRTPLANHSLHQHPTLARIALSHAIQIDDAALIVELVDAGIQVHQPLQGSALPTEMAVRCKAHQAAQALIEAGAPVTTMSLRDINSDIPATLVRLLLDHGAMPTTNAIAQCAACGAHDSARTVAAAYSQKHDDLQAAYASARQVLLGELEHSLKQVQKGRLGHYLGEQGLAERIANLKRFTLA